jgi:hypothetical protein
MPYAERPTELPLDVEECRTALWLNRGNVSKAAERLRVSPNRLRTFIKNSPRLTEEQREAQEQLVDIAEDVAYEALTDEADPARRDQMARYVMTNLGKTRGYGTNTPGVNLNLPRGNLKISWADGSSLSVSEEPEAKVIEHE